MSKLRNKLMGKRAFVSVKLVLLLVLFSTSIVSASQNEWKGTPLGAAGSIWYPGRETCINISFQDFQKTKEIPSLTLYNQPNLNILNPKACPLINGNWTVNFTVKGRADLIVSALKGTFFNRNIKFLGLYCGDEKVKVKTFFSNKSKSDIWQADKDYGYLKVENFYCEDEVKLTLKELETGEHVLEFKFGTEVAYAYNFADCTGTLATPCHECDVNKANVTVKAPGGSTSGPHTMTYINEWGTCGPAYEVGVVTNVNGWTTVNLVNNYVKPIVIVSEQKGNDTSLELEQSRPMIRNVGSNSFEVIVRSDNDNTVTGDVGYIVMERGHHVIDGVEVEAGNYSVSGTGTQTIYYYKSFPGNTVMIDTLQEECDNVSSSRYTEGTMGSDSVSGVYWETYPGDTWECGTIEVGYIAIERGHSSNKFEGNISQDCGADPDSANWCSVSFQNSYSNTPVLFVNPLSSNDGDPTVTGRGSLSTTGVNLRSTESDEDDAEMSHAVEDIPWIVWVAQDNASVVTENWSYNLGYTFCPDEGQYTAMLNFSAEGDTGTYQWENSSWLPLYNVSYDNDTEVSDAQSWCNCYETSGYGITSWLANGINTGGFKNAKCCGDDAGEDWEQTQAAGRSICYNAVEQLHNTLDSSKSLLAYDGQAYDCGSQITFDGSVDTENLAGDRVDSWTCNSSNQWVQDTTPPTVSEINVTPTVESNGINYTNASFLVNATVTDTGGSGINTSSCKICISTTLICSSWVPGIYYSIDEHHGYCYNWSSSYSDGTVLYINVSIEDYAGNVGGGSEIDRTVDATGPTATDVTVTPTSGIYTNSTPYINATITDSASGVASCEYSLDNGTTWSPASLSGSECYTTLSTQPDGKILNVTFRGTDNVGNVGQKATDVQRTVDANPPTLVAYELYPEFPFTYENLTLNITCNNPGPVGQILTAYWDVWNSSQKVTTLSGSQVVPNNVNVNITVVFGENTSVNENWTLEVWCFDTLYYTDHENTSTRRIGIPKYSKFNSSTTNFTKFEEVPDFTSVSTPTLEIGKYGKIIWLSTGVNVTDAYFDIYVNITNNSIVVDTPNLDSSLNSSANLSLYGLTFTDPVILENKRRCTHCVKISYTQGNLTFNVSHFTAFSATENTNLTIWDSTDSEGGSQVKYINEQVTFYANYTLTDGTTIDNTTAHNGTCQIKFNIAGWTTFDNMSYNSTSKLYEYNRSFSQHGIFDYNITCNSSHLVSYISALDNVTITNRAPYIILNSPVNDTWINQNFTLLNWTCYDPDNDIMTAYVYGDNLTSNPATTLINKTENIISGNSYTFNWTNLNNTIYYWKVNCTDSGDLSGLDKSNISLIYQLNVDTIAPTIGEVKVQPTYENLGVNYTNASFIVNASVLDSNSGINGSTCEICNSTTSPCSSWTSGTYDNGYCYKLIGPFSDGDVIYVNVRIKDNASNLGTGDEVNRTIDTQGPVAQDVMVKPSSNGYTNSTPYINATITDSGSGVASCEYSLDNGTTWNTAYWNAGRSECYFQITSPLTNGYVMNVTFRGKDSVGNLGDKAIDVQRTVDAVAPTATNVMVKPTYGIYTNASPYINATITDSGGSGVASCEYSLDNGTTWSPASLSGSECYATLPTQPDGKVLNVTFRGTDNVGNVGQKATDVQRTVDAQAPVVGEIIVTPTLENNGINWTNTTMFVNASITESGSGVNGSTCEICNSTSPPCSSWTPGTYSNGYCYGWIKPYTNGTVVYLNMRIKDNVSNLGTGVEVNRTVDNDTPVVTNVTVYPSSGIYTNSTPYINASVYDSGVGVSSCEYSLDNGSSWSAAYYNSDREECYLNSSDFPVKPDGYVMNVTFRANDSFGLMSLKATAVQRMVDDTPPVQLGSPTVTPTVITETGSYTNSTPYINATFTDSASGVASCEYSIDNGTTWNNANWDSGTSQCSATVSPALANGYVINVTFRATDNANNLGQKGNTTQRTVDAEAPSILSLLVTPSTGSIGDTFEINLTITDSATDVNSSNVYVEIYLFNHSTYTLNLASTKNLTNETFLDGNYNGTWNTTWDDGSSIDGTYIFKFNAADVIGNLRSVYGDSVALGYSPVESETNWTLSAISENSYTTSFNSSLTTVWLTKIITNSDQRNQSVSIAKYHSDPTESEGLTNVLNYVDIYSTISDSDLSSVTMRFYYTDAEMSAAGVPASREEDLTLYRYDSDTGTWDEIGDGIVEGSNYVYATDYKLTGTYAVGLIDSEPPITSHISVDPDPVIRGQNITINATITDIVTGASIISAAEFYIDDDSCALTLGSCNLMKNVTALNDSTEKFTAQYNTLNLYPGVHTVWVRGNDSAKNWMLQPQGHQFTVKENVSTPIILNSSPKGFVNSLEQFLNVTTDVVAHCRYTQEDGNFSLMTSFTNTDSTSHSVNVSSQINEGVNIFFVRCANDSSGKSAMQYSLTIHFILDTQKPVLLSLTPADKAYTNNRNISFSIGDSTSGVNLSSITVKWNGSTSLNFSTTKCSENAHGGYNCSYDEENITEGSNDITIDAKDLAGNSMSTKMTTFTYDVTSPVLSNPKPDSAQTAKHFNVSITTNENSSCRYAYDNVSWDDMAYLLTEISANEHQDKGTVDKNGDYTIYFRCRDLAGNEGYGNTPSFNVDEEEAAAAPSITIGGIEEDYRAGEIVTIYASLTNKTGEPINASTYCNVTIRHWNGTDLEIDLNNVAMNFTGQLGWYYYNWQVPSDAQSGSYGVLVMGDPNGIETQSTSGFHVAPWAEEIKYLWEKYQRVNTSVIHNETITSATLSSLLQQLYLQL
jgi:hypothetical protein